MDKLDAWMEREIGDKSSKKSSKKTSRKRSSQKKRNFSNKKRKAKPAKSGNKPHKQNQNRSKKPTKKPVKAAPKKPTKILKGKVKMIPLGGLNEVGKNMMAFEYENDIIIIDMGLEFPSEDLLGIDYVIPDTTYLEDNKKRIKAVIITHGHLDHIGGIPYILPKLDFPPLYATKLTMGFIKKRSAEFKQEKLTKFREFKANERLKFGAFTLDFFQVAHSIPDAVGVMITTPVGKYVHTGDFKFDPNPAHNHHRTDINKLRKIGGMGITGLFCESTNSLKEGHSISENEVGIILEQIVKDSPKRLIIASFASQMGRIQHILDAAQKHGRKVYLSGRSMTNNIEISQRLGYLKCKKGFISDIRRYKKDKPKDENTLILTTGSQGESVSAMTRIANKDHPHIRIKKGDTIVFSSSPIVGNERAIYSVINNLALQGAEVIHNQMMDVHASGHAKRDELIKMINLVKPKYLIPIHGEYFMRQELGRMAVENCGIKDENVIMIQNGDVLVADKNKISVANDSIETKYILIDGSGEGQLDSPVQVDRGMMKQNGALVILVHIHKKSKRLKKTPDVVSRGFIYMHESEEITKDICSIAGDAYKKIIKKRPTAPRKDIKVYIKQTVDKYTRQKLERRPLIIPLIIEN